MGILYQDQFPKYRSGRHGIVRDIIRSGVTVTFDENRRPVGTPDGKPNVNAAAQAVRNNEQGNFGNGRNIERGSVYDRNTSGVSTGTSQPRSRTAR